MARDSPEALELVRTRAGGAQHTSRSQPLLTVHVRLERCPFASVLGVSPWSFDSGAAGRLREVK